MARIKRLIYLKGIEGWAEEIINSDTDILTNDLVDEMINSIPKSHKNLWEGSRTNLTSECAYTEIRHDNKIIGLCHPEVFFRLVDYCAD